MVRAIPLLTVLVFGLSTLAACGDAPTAKTTTMPFSQVFTVSEGKLTPKVPVQVGSVRLTPAVTMACGTVKISDVDLCTLQGRNLVVEQQGDTLVVKGAQ